MDNGFKIPDDINTANTEIIEDVDNFVEKSDAPTTKALELESLVDDNNIHASKSSLLLYVISFFLIVGLISSYIFLSDKIKDNISKLEAMITVSESTASKGDTKGASVSSLFKVNELGVQLLVRSSFNDLTYVTGASNAFTGTPMNSVFLSSKSITAMDKNCQASSTSTTGSPLGIIAQVKGAYPAQASPKSGVLLVQEQDSYIAFMPSSAKCSTDPRVNQLVNDYRLNLQLNPETTSLAQ